MIESKRIRLRAFEGTDAAANHEFRQRPGNLARDDERHPVPVVLRG